MSGSGAVGGQGGEPRQDGVPRLEQLVHVGRRGIPGGSIPGCIPGRAVAGCSTAGQGVAQQGAGQREQLIGDHEADDRSIAEGDPAEGEGRGSWDHGTSLSIAGVTWTTLVQDWVSGKRRLLMYTITHIYGTLLACNWPAWT
jgi:hypothetical protein